MRNRSFLGILSVVVVLQLVVAACTPAAAPTSTAGAGPAATKPTAAAETKPAALTPTAKPASESPRYGGILTSFVTGNPPSLDTQQESSAHTMYMVAPLYNALVQGDPVTNDKFVPGLAEKWEMSGDALTWTLDIRQGVKWHDGSPFTADDAVYSLKRETDPPKGVVSNLSHLLKPVVKSIDKEGNKVKMTLNYPYAIMLDTLANNYSPVYSQKYLTQHDDMKTTAMGTGPYKLKSYNPGVGFEGVKNSDYWVKGRPYLDGYRFLILKDEATRLSAFRTGKVQMTGKMHAALTPSDMETVKKENPSLKFYRTATLLSSWFMMNTRRPPYQDQKVRKAISLVVDRQAALKALAEGQGIVGKAFPFQGWGIPDGELLKLPGYRQPKDADIAEAKKLMLAAGYPDGFETTIQARTVAVSQKGAVFMTNALAQLGIKAKVQVLEESIFWDMGRKSSHEAHVLTPTPYFTDPHWMGRFFAPGGGLNYTGNETDKELTQMWDEQIRIVDVDKRKALIRKIDEHLLDSVPGVPIVWYYFYIGVHPEVRNFEPGMGDAVGNTLQEIWLAK